MVQEVRDECDRATSEALQKEFSLTVGSATHKVIVNAWAAHSFQTGEDFYVFCLDTTSSGGAGTRVTLKGSDLKSVTEVRFGGVKAESFFPDSETELSVLALEGSGRARVSVISPGGISDTVAFSYK